MNELCEEEIKSKYLKAPTFEEISEFIKELGIGVSQFERYFSIPKSVVRHVKCGNRNLPVKFWPIIYEKKVPQYGIGYTKKVNHQKIPMTKTVTLKPENDGHGRLNRVK